MVDTKITKERLQHHFLYYKWAYILMIALCAGVGTMVYQMTEPKLPPSQVVNVYVLGDFVPEDSLAELTRQGVAAHPEYPGLAFFDLAMPDEGDMQMQQVFMVRIAAAEVDVMIVDKDRFLAENQYSEIFLPLDEYIQSGALRTDIDLGETTVICTPNDSPALPKAVRGVPIDSLQGLAKLGINPENKVLTVVINSPNPTGAVATIQWMLDTFAQ